ncbi:MGDG synthase family glycosyltransferase [Desulfosporosinus shakirovi]|uniref:MGDG synthase family glycosyltransferase n=1 Tax=Desulfosporosinus shakirovi TaxID=2885154 RepID=UPI001E386656|nr:glycosyltransferase [Desulfosporosinus sp. SRJS8]MCB8817685.1 UDP-N-acetylglucosamine--LPS N-acetylglucosamine transferase [Desulfosporosinus sp. SRJS8]
MKQLRILVFSAGFGNGHFRAAEAVIEGLRLKAPEAEIIHLDFGDFLSKRLNTMAKIAYLEMTKYTPKIWEKLYNITDRLQPESRIQRLLKQMGRRDFLQYIQAFAPDLIVCTYPTISSILAQLRLEQLLQVPIITVITDYTLHSHWVHPGVDRYMVACEEVKASLVSWGIKAPRILVTGIPVSPKFDLEMDRGSIISRLGLRTNIPTFLVMGGAYGGSKSVTRICKTLTDSPVPVQMIVVCGKNTRLYHSLGEVIEDSVNPMVRLSYVHNLEELMSVSDLIITKAGGLTVSEALTKHLPLVIYKAIPGQEEENARFVEGLGAGQVAGTEEELGWILKRFLSTPKEMEKIRAQAAIALPGHSTERAVEAMLQLTMNRRNEQKIG